MLFDSIRLWVENIYRTSKMDGSSWTCSQFEPQQWRRTKCKQCFEDINFHSNISSGLDNANSKSDNGLLGKIQTGFHQEDHLLSSEQPGGEEKDCLEELVRTQERLFELI